MVEVDESILKNQKHWPSVGTIASILAQYSVIYENTLSQFSWFVRIALENGVIREVQEFCYFGDMLGCEEGAERAVRVRVSSTWRK